VRGYWVPHNIHALKCHMTIKGAVSESNRELSGPERIPGTFGFPLA
jgi:hypothetical protein